MTDSEKSPGPSEQDTTRLVDMNAFFSEVEIELWKKILGPELHYHFGYFENGVSVEDAMRQTVRNFFRFIPSGCRLLDAGCGWGGPARLLEAEHGCKVVGVTVSQAQALYCREQGIETHWIDLETGVPDGDFDVALFLESLEHMVAKREILARVAERCSRVIVSSNTWNHDAPLKRPDFGRSLDLQDMDELCTMLSDAGFTVDFVYNRRPKSRQSVHFWNQNLKSALAGHKVTGQLAALREFSAFASASEANWATFEQSSPLVDIVADRRP